MFARVTTVEIDTLRSSVDEALQQYRDNVMPLLVDQPGYQGVYVLANPTGEGMLISFWDTEEQAEPRAETGFYAQVLGEHVTLFRSPPGRDAYEVVYVDQPQASGRPAGAVT